MFNDFRPVNHLKNLFRFISQNTVGPCGSCKERLSIFSSNHRNASSGFAWKGTYRTVDDNFLYFCPVPTVTLTIDAISVVKSVIKVLNLTAIDPISVISTTKDFFGNDLRGMVKNLPLLRRAGNNGCPLVHAVMCDNTYSNICMIIHASTL